MAPRRLVLTLSALLLPVASLTALAPPAALAVVVDCGDLVPALDSPAIIDAGWVECTDPSAHDGASELPAELSATGGTVALMTTGEAANAKPDSPSTSKDWGVTAHGWAGDVSTYRVRVDVPAEHNCVVVDLAMGTYEPREDPYQDGFVAILDGNDWQLEFLGQSDYQISGSNVFASVLSGAVKDAGHPVAGIGYTVMSGPMALTVGLSSGVHDLYLSVFDGPPWTSNPLVGGNATRDGAEDSGVFLDDLRTFADPEGCASPVNALPQAQDEDPVVAYHGEPRMLDVVANDYDPDGDPLTTVGVVTPPAHGVAECEGTTCTYTAADGHEGADSFVYRVTDGAGGYSTATVPLDVRPNGELVETAIDVFAEHVQVVSRLTRLGGTPLAGVDLSLLAGLSPDALVEVAVSTTGDEGYATFQHEPTSTGTWHYRVERVDDPGVADVGASVFFDVDPISEIEVTGPSFLATGAPATFVIRGVRSSGAVATSGTISHRFRLDAAGFATDPMEAPIVDGRVVVQFPGGGLGEEWALEASSGPSVLTLHPFSIVEHVVTAASIRGPAVVTWPGRPTLTGQLTGSGVQFPSVAVDLRRGSGSSVVDDPVNAPSATGALAGQPAVAPRSRTVYRWNLPTYGVASPALTVLVRPLVSLSAARVRRKDVISGRVTPARAGTPVVLERRLTGGSWRAVASIRIARATGALTVASGSPYRFAIRKRAGAKYRVLLPADDGRVATRSVARRAR